MPEYNCLNESAKKITPEALDSLLLLDYINYIRI